MTEFEYDENVGKTKYYDKHTLSLIVYTATYEQIVKVIENAINQTGIACAFKINLIEPKDGIRYAYVRLSEPSVYYAIVGLNYDGTERYEWIDDPNFKMPKIPLEDALKDINDDDWADISFAEDEIRDRYVPRKIKRELEPLVDIIPYDDEDHTIDIMRAFVILKEEPYQNNVIFGIVPSWVNYSILSPYFNSFVTDPQERKQTKTGPKSYPLIRFIDFNNKKKVYIEFSNKSRDANFCLLMNKFIVIEHNGKRERISFDYCRESNNRENNRDGYSFKKRDGSRKFIK